MGRIHAISFDLDDTFWPSQPVLEHAEAVFYRELERRAPRLVARYTPDDLRQQRIALLQHRPDLRHHISDWRRISLIQALQSCDYGEQSEAIANAVFADFLDARQRVSLFDDVEAVLEVLSQRYVLVSLTNGNADLSCLPCSRFFKASLKAEDIGISKPHAAAFEAACNAAGYAPGHVLHIGDHPKDDVHGALNAGLRAVQALMPGVDRPRHEGAEGYFNDWRQLPALLDELQQLR